MTCYVKTDNPSHDAPGGSNITTIADGLPLIWQRRCASEVPRLQHPVNRRSLRPMPSALGWPRHHPASARNNRVKPSAVVEPQHFPLPSLSIIGASTSTLV